MPGNDSSTESALSKGGNDEGCHFKYGRHFNESISSAKEELSSVHLSQKFEHVNDNRNIAAPEISRNSRSSHGHPFPPVLNPTIHDRSNSRHTTNFSIDSILGNNYHSSNKTVGTESSFKKIPFEVNRCQFPFYAQDPVLPVKERSHFTPVNSPCDENSYKCTGFKNFMEPSMYVKNYFPYHYPYYVPSLSSNEIPGNENKRLKLNGSCEQPNPSLFSDPTGWPRDSILRQNFENCQSFSMNGCLRDGKSMEKSKDISSIYLDKQSMALNVEVSNSDGESGKDGSQNSKHEIMTSTRIDSNDLPGATAKSSSPPSQQSINGQVGRKRSAPFPDDKKDEKYYERREKNNLAAKKSRQKRRENERKLKEENSRLIQENLKLELKLENTRNQLEQEQKKNELFTKMSVGNLVLCHNGMPGI
ncbi:hypothetical protein CDAR_301681 [Caerostris darwini]|uniref:BZIP domain-containing protein n=1 Tax=Caerostris darwini TaxID=1538125 RepID=A0AAV4N4F1_9ARAC|nr:hypothetical protein CDAR_301681 [Caerostris darwini]